MPNIKLFHVYAASLQHYNWCICLTTHL